MRHPSRQLALGVSLLAVGISLLFIHYLVFARLRETLYYVFMDVAFIPLHLLVAGMILDRWLRARERQALLSKLNTVVGTFFSEVGTPLLRLLLEMDPNHATRATNLRVATTWKARDFTHAAAELRTIPFRVEVTPAQLQHLRTWLIGKREFLLRLLENPNLLEHETFTELLLATFHLTEELTAREELAQLPPPDYQHLALDINRVYNGLAREWLAHLAYLQRDYPFLFSFAIRTNPFHPAAAVVISS